MATSAARWRDTLCHKAYGRFRRDHPLDTAPGDSAAMIRRVEMDILAVRDEAFSSDH